MATVTLTINSALGQNSTVLTFSPADATRIFTAWQSRIQPGGTQTQFAAWLGTHIQNLLSQYVVVNEQVAVVPPSIAAQTT